MVDEIIIDDLGIIYFDDLSSGIYLNLTNPSRYYEIKRVIDGLNIKDNDLNAVIYSSSTATKNKTIIEDE